MLYAELRSGIAYAFENRKDYLTILNELLIEVYTCFEEEVPEFKTVKEIIYWYASDYCDVFLADRIEEQLIPELSIATEWIMEADLDDERYLYRFGEYITENEIGTARHLANLSDEVLQKMADVYTEGYRIGFINTGKDLSKKAVVDLRYCLGFERVVKIAIENFRKMGLEPAIYRAASSVITRKEQFKIGYYGAIANPQYDNDHRSDQALFMDKRYVERKLDILKNTYEKNKDQAALMGGPAVMEIFGEKPFSPDSKQENLTYDEAQRELTLLYTSKSGQLTNQYIKGEERSFTIVAYPIPEIGEQYKEIFDEVIKINTLDANLYEKVQQTMIDALDQGESVRILGKGENKTDLTVQLYKLNNPEKETIFENCVADVNIPVGEVFTSPVLEGTNGTLHVSKVFLEGLQYCNLEIQFKDGMIESCTCSNFDISLRKQIKRCNININNLETRIINAINSSAYDKLAKIDFESLNNSVFVGTGGSFAGAKFSSKLINYLYGINTTVLYPRNLYYRNNNSVDSVFLFTYSGTTNDLLVSTSLIDNDNKYIITKGELQKIVTKTGISKNNVISYRTGTNKGKERGFLSFEGALAPASLFLKLYFENKSKDNIEEFIRDSISYWKNYFDKYFKENEKMLKEFL